MLLYSHTSKVFIERVREEIRSLFFLEISPHLPLTFRRSRILYKNFQFPLNLVVFEDNSRLGYFDYRHFEIGISKKLMYLTFDHVLKNVIRHELLHYIAYLLHGPDLGHGEEFKNLARKLNWNEEVFSAYSNLENENSKLIVSEKVNEKQKELFNKIKKLLALASSENVHESELATMKANQLLLEYNLSKVNLESEDEKEIYVKRVLESSKKNAKHLAIYEILKTFYVSPVFNHGRGIFYLEVVGSHENVEMAEYVAQFLDHELERLWNAVKKENPNLKGIVAKNSFMRGLAQGFVSKIKNSQKTVHSNALLKLNQDLSQNLNFVYQRLGHSYQANLKNNTSANQFGRMEGEKLTIRPGLQSSNHTLLLS